MRKAREAVKSILLKYYIRGVENHLGSRQEKQKDLCKSYSNHQERKGSKGGEEK